ncbi:thioesterase II family protein [Acetivibrio cellulolyticus]|uniref:thioesterase II family protein n=1 Tax=Acetivibrio cellulolyticus TaxID=35830 RepID=UPI0001E2F59A|nr:thioesterase domain-containing protein [Acetivibrio cellulolyticus]
MDKIKLFCLPFAGGSAVTYRKWKDYLHSFIEIWALELKGRGKRFNEPFYLSIKEAVEDLYKIIEPEIVNSQFAFFGHSMGTILAYELVNQIKREKQRDPLHIFFSGRYPPHADKRRKVLHDLPDDEFIAEIESYGGTPKGLFDNKELLEIFLPVLRADYKILDNYRAQQTQVVYDFDISVLGGRYDSEVSAVDLRQWYKYTNGDCRVYEFEGGHFFINDYIEDIVKIINSTLGSKKNSIEDIYRILFD